MRGHAYEEKVEQRTPKEVISPTDERAKRSEDLSRTARRSALGETRDRDRIEQLRAELNRALEAGSEWESRAKHIAEQSAEQTNHVKKVATEYQRIFDENARLRDRLVITTAWVSSARSSGGKIGGY